MTLRENYNITIIFVPSSPPYPWFFDGKRLSYLQSVTVTDTISATEEYVTAGVNKLTSHWATTLQETGSRAARVTITA